MLNSRSKYSEVSKLLECSIADSSKIGVYYIKSIVNNKLYIGSTQNNSDYGFYRRWLNHYFYLKNGTHHSTYLQNHCNKHGINSFRFGIIEECDKKDCLEREHYWINKLDTYKNGFNGTDGVVDFIIGEEHPNYKNIDENIAIKLYTEDILSCKKIGNILGVGASKIARVLRKNNITIERNIYRAPLKQIYYRYFLGGESLQKLSEEFFCARPLLAKEFKKMGYLNKSEYMKSLKEDALLFIKNGGTLKDFCKYLPVNYTSMCCVINNYYGK